ncbi:MAG TPA: transposase [Candidatus Paceibacterota bacterium]|nr:transposase [Candidatus Paceibacterota bacterium]
MGRAHRVDVGNTIYHVLNRANSRSRLFEGDEEYQSFLAVLREGQSYVPMRILAYCLMPNHWHFVLYPREDGDLSKFMQRVTLTHTQRYHAKTSTKGYGHLYQGRYKSFPVQDDLYFLTLVRYVERNAKRAAMVERAEEWPWSSVCDREHGKMMLKHLSPWPIPIPDDYLEWLNRPQPKEEIEAIRYAVRRNRPYGSSEWAGEMVERFGLQNTMRGEGRPRKTDNGT